MPESDSHQHPIIGHPTSWAYVPERLPRMFLSEPDMRMHVATQHSTTPLFTLHTSIDKLHDWHERRHAEWDSTRQESVR